MKLHEDNDFFKELIEYAADRFGYRRPQVEKDYWITAILKDIASTDFGDMVYFKGGTSLSKAYNLTDRFSEDLDLFLFTGNKESSGSSEKGLNKKARKFIEHEYGDFVSPDKGKSGGFFNKLVLNYNPIFSGSELKENLEVELKSCEMKNKSPMFYPSDKRFVQSIIGKYLYETGNESLANKFGLEPFEVNCLNPRKTICDKISRITKLSNSQDSVEELAKHIRDIYDLGKILEVPEYKLFMESREFLDGMYGVWIEDMYNNSAKTHLPLGKSLLFSSPSEVLENDKIKDAYKNSLRRLVYQNVKMPSIEDLETRMSFLSKCLNRFDTYRLSKTEESTGRISNVRIFKDGIGDDAGFKIGCIIDGKTEVLSDISKENVFHIDRGELSLGMAALVCFGKELNDEIYSFDKDLSIGSPFMESEKNDIVSIISRLSDLRYPGDEITEAEYAKIRDYFSFVPSELKEKYKDDVQILVRQDPRTNKNGLWLDDAIDIFNSIADSGVYIGHGKGLGI